MSVSLYTYISNVSLAMVLTKIVKSIACINYMSYESYAKMFNFIAFIVTEQLKKQQHTGLSLYTKV